MSDNKCASDIVITSVASYLEAIHQCETGLYDSVDANDAIPEEDKPAMKYFYRGHASAEWPLMPTLFRPIPSVTQPSGTVQGIRASYYPEEQYFIQESERIFPHLFVSCKNDVSRMAVAQHHGIPTRLLDVSGNVLVALYFATQEYSSGGKGHDGRVFVLRANANDYKMASTGGSIAKICIREYHSKQGPSVQSNHPLLVFPPFMTSRQRAQDGAFYLFQNDGNIIHHFQEGAYGVVTIPCSAKLAIQQELESMFNVHKGTLFPEMLESYADKLKRDAARRIRAERQI